MRLTRKLKCLSVGLIALAAGVYSISAAAPPNDLCSGAEIIPAGGPFPHFSAVVDVKDATTAGDPPGPSAACYPGSVSRSIWYRFTPSATGLYTISSGPDTATTVADTVMAVYTASGSCTGFSQVACNDDPAGRLAALSLNLNAGVTYYVVVWINGTDPLISPNTTVQVKFSKPVAPANDSCGGAENIPGNGPFPHLTSVVDNTLANNSGDPSWPTCRSQGTRSVWFRFTPERTAVYTLSVATNTATTAYDTLMGIYTSPNECAGPFAQHACNDDVDIAQDLLQSAVTTSLQSNVTYYIVIWTWDDQDPYVPGETSIQMRVERWLPPSVITLAASDICSTGAVLNAVVTPNASQSFAWFEWGATTNYGNMTPPQHLGSGNAELGVSANIALSGSGPFQFRIRATNSFGTATGSDLAFTWNPAPPQLHSVAFSSNSLPRVQFTGAARHKHIVQGSTNLVHWVPLGTAAETGVGQFVFEDAAGGTLMQRFYRVYVP